MATLPASGKVGFSQADDQVGWGTLGSPAR